MSQYITLKVEASGSDLDKCFENATRIAEQFFDRYPFDMNFISASVEAITLTGNVISFKSYWTATQSSPIPKPASTQEQS